MRYLPPLLAAACLLLACNRKTARATADKLPARRNATQLLGDIERSLYVPRIAEMTGDVDIDAEGLGRLSLKATIRTQADSVFWISLRKLGFEGGRARVTRDSVIALNRLQREAMIGTVADLPAEAAALPFEPTLANLQAAFGGAPIGEWREAEVERLPGAYAMRLPAEPAAQLLVRAGAQPTPIEWRYRSGERYGRVTFGDFREAGRGQVFPYRRTFVYSDSPGDTSRLTLQLSSITAADALDFPLSIPRSYERKGF